MREWIANGAQLAWLIDPSRRAVDIFRPACEPEIREDALQVEGEGARRGLRARPYSRLGRPIGLKSNSAGIQWLHAVHD